MSSKLFRTEVMQFRAGSEFGESVFYQPISIKLMILCFVGIFSGFIALGATAQIKQTERVRGYLSAIAGENKVFASRSGVISQIFVDEGTYVNRGEVLAVLVDAAYDGAGESVADIQLLNLDKQFNNLEARRQSVLHKSALEQGVLTARLSALQAELNLLQQELLLQHQKHVIAEADLTASNSLFDRGLIAARELNQIRSVGFAVQQQLLAVQQSIGQRDSAAAEARLQLDMVSVAKTDELLRIEELMLVLRQRRDELHARRSFAIVAPASGVVKNLVGRAGDALDSRLPLLTIVAEQQYLEALLFLPSRSMGDVAPGQLVHLHYDAYPYQIFGSFPAQIRSVANTALDPREHLIPLNLHESVFLVRAEIEHQWISGQQKEDQRALLSGMLLSADIVTGRQTVLRRIFSPVDALRSRL
jgi:membrane fusion protein